MWKPARATNGPSADGPLVSVRADQLPFRYSAKRLSLTTAGMGGHETVGFAAGQAQFDVVLGHYQVSARRKVGCSFASSPFLSGKPLFPKRLAVQLTHKTLQADRRRRPRTESETICIRPYADGCGR